ncbi:MAG TPA: histidinol dehydrogenase [Desulfotomaculum sp.]|nr:histidinol dehydrogenase [Desulfotomaculum sp.]
MPIRIIHFQEFEKSRFFGRQFSSPAGAGDRVKDILTNVREQGDKALCAYTEAFDGVKLQPGQLKVTDSERKEAYRQADEGFLESLRFAMERIEDFHKKQLPNSWFDTGKQGIFLGQLVRPLARVGIYVPGGTAAYPSSVLMNAVPARVAGVKEIVMVTPPSADGGINKNTIIAAVEAGVTEIYKAGGAQAVAALAYGTESIKPVDKITGPGNIYVTLAKQQVYGRVDIDMLAGPSEVVIVADDSADPCYIAADLLAQAEHDPLSTALLFTPGEALANLVRDEIARQLPSLSRKNIASRSLEDQGAVVITDNLEKAMELANSFAPEHLELVAENPFHWLTYVRNAGAVFLGPYSPESIGDYLAGPNHILPTGGTARFFSPLSVDAFLKKSSVISFSREALAEAGEHVSRIARLEGLDAHAKTIEKRLGGS